MKKDKEVEVNRLSEWYSFERQGSKVFSEKDILDKAEWVEESRKWKNLRSNIANFRDYPEFSISRAQNSFGRKH